MALHQRDLHQGCQPYGEPEPRPPSDEDRTVRPVTGIDPSRLAGALIVTVGAAAMWMAIAAILWWLVG